MLNRAIPPAPAGWTLAATGRAWAEYQRQLIPAPRRIRKYARITIHDSGKVFGRDATGYLREFGSVKAAAEFLNQFCA